MSGQMSANVEDRAKAGEWTGAFVVKGAIHNRGLIGGIGLKVLDAKPLHAAVGGSVSKVALESSS